MNGNPNIEGSPPSLDNSLHSHHSNGYNSIYFTSTTFTDNYSRNDNENIQNDFGYIAAPPNIQLSQEPQMSNEMHNAGDMEMGGFQLSPTASFFQADQVYDFIETDNGPLPVSQQPIADERIDGANMMSDFQMESEENDDEIEPNPQPSPSKMVNQNTSPPSYLHFMDSEPISQEVQPITPPLVSSSRKIFSCLEYQPRIYEERKIKNLTSESSESLKNVDILEPNQLNMNYFMKTGFRNIILVNSINKMTDFYCPEITRDNLIITLTGLDLKAYNIDSRKYESFNQNQWLEIYNHASVTHKTILAQSYRFISTDISNTILNSFRLPKIIHDLDFKSQVPKYKDIRSGLYLLMAVSGFYCDFHIEQSGTATWYYCCDGDLSFYLIEPSEENLELFKDWYESHGIDSNMLYTDMCDNDGNFLKEKMITITLKVGDFMIIPSGWIYSFYCSSNAILFSGNFLHGFDLLVELYIRDLEETLKYPDNILYDNFQEELWHGCQKYLATLRLNCFNNNNSNYNISVYELNGLPSLICSLSNWFQCLSDESDNDTYDNNIREAANNAAIATHCNGPLDMLSELITRIRKEQWKERKSSIPKISYSVESETTMQQVLGDGNDNNNDNNSDDDNDDDDDDDDSESESLNRNRNMNNNHMIVHSIGKAPPAGIIGSGKYIPNNNNNNKNSNRNNDSYSDDNDNDNNSSDDDDDDDLYNYNNNNRNSMSQQQSPSLLPSTYFVDCTCGLRGMNLKDDLPLVQCCICQVYFHKEHIIQSNNSNRYYCHKCKEKQQQQQQQQHQFLSYPSQSSPIPPDLPPKPPALPPKPILNMNNKNRNSNNNVNTKKVVKINENDLLPSKKRRRRSIQKEYDIDDDYVEKEKEYIYSKDDYDDGDDDEDYGDDDDDIMKKKKSAKKRKRTNYYVNQINADRKAQNLLLQQQLQQKQNGIIPVVLPPPKKKENKSKNKKESSFKNIMKNLKKKRD